MLRERAAGSYVISAYFLAKSAADFLFQIWAPVIFTCIVYPSVGFADTPGQFMVFMGFMILTSNATSSLMNMLSCLFVSIEMSTVVAACSWEILRLYGEQASNADAPPSLSSQYIVFPGLQSSILHHLSLQFILCLPFPCTLP